MKKGGGSVSTIIIGPSKSALVYALHSLEYVLGLARFRVFVPNYIYKDLWSCFYEIQMLYDRYLIHHIFIDRKLVVYLSRNCDTCYLKPFGFRSRVCQQSMFNLFLCWAEKYSPTTKLRTNWICIIGGNGQQCSIAGIT